jgi:pimeloyl-ACP methyl ester carboxylesterase
LHRAESSNADFITKVALLHGADDPRTDPGELDAFRRSLPSAQVRLIANGEHCPHNESRSVEVFTRLLLGALQWFAGDAKSF